MNKKNLLSLFILALLFQLTIFLWLGRQQASRNLKNLTDKFSVAVFPAEPKSVVVVAEKLRRRPEIDEVRIFSAEDVLEKVRSQAALSGLYLPEDNPFHPYILVKLKDFTIADLDLFFENILGLESFKYDKDLYTLIQDFSRQRANWQKGFWLIIIWLLVGIAFRFIFLSLPGNFLTDLIYRFGVIGGILLVNYLIFKQILLPDFRNFLYLFLVGLLIGFTEWR